MLTPCLWFAGEAEEAAATITRYGEAGREIHGRPDRARADRAMTAMLRMKKLDIAALKRAMEG